MHGRRSGRARLDLTGLSPEIRGVVESLIDDGEVDITRSGAPVGTLAFTSTVLDGSVLPPDPPGRTGQGPQREGVMVVPTTMLMSDAARRRLSDAFGPDYLVLDFLDVRARTSICRRGRWSRSPRTSAVTSPPRLARNSGLPERPGLSWGRVRALCSQPQAQPLA
ncbi:MAG: hypothetical protein ACXVYY_09485 [Oryzihumus sp.]